MNSLSKAYVLAENRLCATLDATTRKADLSPTAQVLLSDTVGFIRKLPHNLIESFKSTLDEVRESDLLMHVVDVTHPGYEDQIRVVGQTLSELGAADKPTLTVFNKIDTLDGHAMLARLEEEYHPAAFVSALRGIGLDELRRRLLKLIEADSVVAEVTLPAAAGRALAKIRRLSEIVEEEYLDNGSSASRNGVLVRLRYRATRQNQQLIRPIVDGLRAAE
jgi:GTP-binding protein HflX